MQEIENRAREIIDSLVLNQKIKDELLARLDAFRDVPEKMEEFMKRLEMLELSNKRLELQAQITDFMSQRGQLVNATKKKVLEILEEKKGEHEKGEVEDIKARIREFPS